MRVGVRAGGPVNQSASHRRGSGFGRVTVCVCVCRQSRAEREREREREYESARTLTRLSLVLVTPTALVRRKPQALLPLARSLVHISSGRSAPPAAAVLSLPQASSPPTTPPQTCVFLCRRQEISSRQPALSTVFSTRPCFPRPDGNPGLRDCLLPAPAQTGILAL